MRIGKPVHRFASVASTNDEAKRLAAEGAPEGTVVLADEQSAGRGRRGRVWASPKGNLYLSAILRPRIEPGAAPPLAPAMGLAVALAVEDVAPVTAELKWPNDVLVGGKKVSGVLTESVISGSKLAAVIVGIGVNVGVELPPELAEIATTLSREAVRNVRRAEMEGALLQRMTEVYARFLEGGFAAVHEDWESRDALRGRKVTIDAGGRKIAGEGSGIAQSGALLVRTERGVEEIATGEVL